MCDKKSFLTFEAATTCINHIKKTQRNAMSNKKRIPKRAYRCPDCGLFHLTAHKTKAIRNHVTKTFYFDYNHNVDTKLLAIWRKSSTKKNNKDNDLM